MKTIKLIAIAVMLLVATAAMAQNQVETRYTESYNWHGFKTFDRDYVHPAVATEVQGIDVSAVSHVGETHDDVEYWDTVLGYTLPVDGLNISAGYGYLLLPGMDAQEFSLTAQMPGTISPRYTISHVELDNAAAGQIHVLGVDIALGDPESVSAVLALEATYNDGVNPFGGPVISDWTHATAGLTVNVPMGNMIWQPAIFYQHTMEPEALGCERDEVWYGVGVSYAF